MKKRSLFSYRVRFLLTFVLLSALPMVGFCEEGLKIANNSGFISSYGFSKVAKLTFVNESMSVISPSGAVSETFLLSAIQNVTFGDVIADGITNNYVNRSIRVYPNPATKSISISGVESGLVSIYSIVGAKVFETQLLDSSNKIDVASLSPGVYVISVNGKSLKFNKK